MEYQQVNTKKRNYKKNLIVISIQTILSFFVFYNEVLIFYTNISRCNFSYQDSWGGIETNKPTHVLVISDPQLTDEYSYKQTGVLLWLTEFYSDLFMRKHYRLLSYLKKIDYEIVLGDLFDGGREWDDERYF